MRRVPLLEPARAALEAWRTEQRGRRVACRADELVWPNRDGAIYGDGYDAGWANRRQNRNGRRWTSLGARWHLGIARRVPFKDLRHTCACHLLRGTWVARGWIARPLSLIEIRDWLGHRSITTTEKYYARLAPGGLLDVLPLSR